MGEAKGPGSTAGDRMLIGIVDVDAKALHVMHLNCSHQKKSNQVHRCELCIASVVTSARMQ